MHTRFALSPPESGTRAVVVAPDEPVEHRGHPTPVDGEHGEDGAGLDGDGVAVERLLRRVGPVEVEECLLKHPAVALAAVIGVPDPIRTESIKAFLVLKPGRSGDAALAREIQEFVKTKLAAHEYPRAVEFVDSLPMTTTGKIMRRELRARETAKA